MSSGATSILLLILAAAAALVILAVGGWLLWKILTGIFWLLAVVFRAIGRFFAHIGRFVAGMFRDGLRLMGHTVTALAYVPAIALNILLGRWSNANHYGTALESELMGGVNCLWRLAFGHLARLLLLSPMVEGLEQRLPDVILRAPGADRPSGGSNAFEGWKVTGALQGGGSGAKLWLAEPTSEKRRALLGAGRACPDKVVIKSFSLEEGSTLPQIVRENRALAAARELGLVIEHELTSSRFHYVMPFVPGEDLGLVTARLHARSGPAGLDDEPLRAALGYSADLLGTLDRFHRAGLWHKDVKPSNILVSDGRVHLVDLGLITPLASAMTLTTHGTEYFRDPEMVKLALKGVKVHEVDGVKFDVFGAGAVLFSMLENSFPQHGSLSQVTRRCPEALRWIVRRAMADMANRYPSAQAMLADLRVVQGAEDPFRVRPAELPSLAGAQDPATPPAAPLASPAGASASAPAPSGAVPRREPVAPLAAGAPRRRWGGVFTFGAGKLARGVLLVFALLLMLPVAASFFFLFVPLGRQAAELVTGETFTHGEPEISTLGDAPPLVPRHDGIERLQPVSLDRLPASAGPALQPAKPPAGLVLLLDDLPPGDEAHAALHARMLQDLHRRRFATLGADDPQDDATLAVTGFTPEDEIALLAGARAAVGLSDPSDEEAVGRLAEWLRGEDQRLDAVVWVGRADAGQPVVRRRVVARKADLATLVARALE